MTTISENQLPPHSPDLKSQSLLSTRHSKTPYDDVLESLSKPIGCGYKGCESVIFGIQPIPDFGDVIGFEKVIASHFYAAGHKRRKIRETK